MQLHWWLAQPHSPPHLQTVTWKCNYTCSALAPSPPIKKQSCENATALAQPYPPPHVQTIMWKCNYTCSAPPLPTYSQTRMQLHLLSPSSQCTYKQSCENATTLTQPLLPHHIQRNSHVRMQIHLLSPSSHPILQTNSHVQMQLQSSYR